METGLAEVSEAELLAAGRQGRMLDCALAPPRPPGAPDSPPASAAPHSAGAPDSPPAGAAPDRFPGAARRRPVDAALLRRCCLELKDQIDPRGLRLRHATVTGPLDLAGWRCLTRSASRTASSARPCSWRAPSCKNWP